MPLFISAGDLRLHSWFTGDPVDEKRKGAASIDGNVSVILSLKELLNVSSDWTDVKNSHKQSMMGSASGPGSVSTQTGGNGGSSVPSDF